MEQIINIGSLFTITEFRAKDGSMFKIKVYFETSSNVAFSLTEYKCSVYTKNKWCSNWHYKGTKTAIEVIRNFSFITENQLYTALYNHWNKLNPIRIFNRSETNGLLGDFSVKEKLATTEHRVY